MFLTRLCFAGTPASNQRPHLSQQVWYEQDSIDDTVSPESGVDPIVCHDFSVIIDISYHESYMSIMNNILNHFILSHSFTLSDSFKMFELKVLVRKSKSCCTLAAWPLDSGLQSGTFQWSGGNSTVLEDLLLQCQNCQNRKPKKNTKSWSFTTARSFERLSL